MIYTKKRSKLEGQFILDLITKKTLKKQKILNAGCGSNWIKEYSPKNVEVIGLDINNPVADIQADLNLKLPIEANSFDGIICTSVLEHLQSPINILKEFHRILKKKGRVFISVPSPWDLSTWEDPYHYRPYTVGALSILAKDSNFKIIKSFYLNKTPLFGVLRLNKIDTFFSWYKYKLKLSKFIPYLRGAAIIVLEKD